MILTERNVAINAIESALWHLRGNDQVTLDAHLILLEALSQL